MVVVVVVELYRRPHEINWRLSLVAVASLEGFRKVCDQCDHHEIDGVK